MYGLGLPILMVPFGIVLRVGGPHPVARPRSSRPRRCLLAPWAPLVPTPARLDVLLGAVLVGIVDAPLALVVGRRGEADRGRPVALLVVLEAGEDAGCGDLPVRGHVELGAPLGVGDDLPAGDEGLGVPVGAARVRLGRGRAVGRLRGGRRLPVVGDVRPPLSSFLFSTTTPVTTAATTTAVAATIATTVVDFFLLSPGCGAPGGPGTAYCGTVGCWYGFGCGYPGLRTRLLLGNPAAAPAAGNRAGPAADIPAADRDSAAGTPAAGTGSDSGPAGSARPRAAAVLATWRVTIEGRRPVGYGRPREGTVKAAARGVLRGAGMVKRFYS